MHTYERHACTHVTRAPHNPVIEQLRNQTPNLLNDPDHWQHTGPIRVFTLVCVFFFPQTPKCIKYGSTGPEL